MVFNAYHNDSLFEFTAVSAVEEVEVVVAVEEVSVVSQSYIVKQVFHSAACVRTLPWLKRSCAITYSEFVN